VRAILAALPALALALILAGACRAEPSVAEPAPTTRNVTKEAPMTAPTSIGIATLNADGSLTLQLRAEGPSGARGDAQFVYKPTDPMYQKMLDHVGGLKPGETKPVPPWPEK